MTLKKGFSTLEILTVLALMAFLALQSFAWWQGEGFFSSHQRLNFEGEKLLLFLQHLRQQANDSNKKWGVALNRGKNDWCVIGWQKEQRETLPPCSCDSICLKENVLIYQPFYPQQTTIKSRYPLPYGVTTFNGVRNTAKANHFFIQHKKNCLKITFHNALNIHLAIQSCQ